LTFITPAETNTRKINEYLARLKSLGSPLTVSHPSSPAEKSTLEPTFRLTDKMFMNTLLGS